MPACVTKTAGITWISAPMHVFVCGARVKREEVELAIHTSSESAEIFSKGAWYFLLSYLRPSGEGNVGRRLYYFLFVSQISWSSFFFWKLGRHSFLFPPHFIFFFIKFNHSFILCFALFFVFLFSFSSFFKHLLPKP